jgi:uncharacterized protein YcbX
MARLTLSAINVYPVKSAGGLSQLAWDIDGFGLRFDRRWMVVDGGGDFLSQRTHPKLALVRPELRPDSLVLRVPSLPDLAIPIAPDGRGEDLSVTVWGGATQGTRISPTADDWFGTLLGHPCRFVFMREETVRAVRTDYAFGGERTSFTDGFPFLLITEESLADLNRRIANPLPMNRFRPNLVVAGAAPFAEDRWRRIGIGAVTFRIAKPCPRCLMTTVDQTLGLPTSPEPLRTLATFRRNAEGQVEFGQNLLHAGTGRIEVGMPVEILD